MEGGKESINMGFLRMSAMLSLSMNMDIKAASAMMMAMTSEQGGRGRRSSCTLAGTGFVLPLPTHV